MHITSTESHMGLSSIKQEVEYFQGYPEGDRNDTKRENYGVLTQHPSLGLEPILMARNKGATHKEMMRECRQPHSSLCLDPSHHSEAFSTNHCQIHTELT